MSVWKSTMRLSVRVINSQSIKKPAVMWLAVRWFMIALTLFQLAFALVLTLNFILALIVTPEVTDSLSGL